MLPPLSQKVLLGLIYLASLLASLSYALPLYVNSSLLSKFISAEKAVGIVFAVAAAISIVVTLNLPHILKRFGNYRFTLAVVAVEIFVLVVLGTTVNPFFVILAFILHQILSIVIYLNLSTFLEAFSSNESTGGIRGIFLTLVNTAFVIGPFLAGMMLVNGGFNKIYLAAAVFMVAVYIVIYTYFKNYKDPIYEAPALLETLRVVRKSHDIHAIIFVQFLLNFFFAWMVIYTPIYLNTQIGIPMSDILSIIIPIALLPFVLFQIVLGKIADNKLGEKEILVAGFVLIVISTVILSFITTSSVAVWAIALFITRVGASAVEVMSESYFFKQVGPHDVHLITFAYTVRSSAYIVGPLLGSLALMFIDYRFLFAVLGVIMLVGIPYSLHFKDSK